MLSGYQINICWMNRWSSIQRVWPWATVEYSVLTKQDEEKYLHLKNKTKNHDRTSKLLECRQPDLNIPHSKWSIWPHFWCIWLAQEKGPTETNTGWQAELNLYHITHSHHSVSPVHTHTHRDSNQNLPRIGGYLRNPANLKDTHTKGTFFFLSRKQRNSNEATGTIKRIEKFFKNI